MVRKKLADHALDIATPSRLAMKIGKQVTGFDFQLFRWLAYVEQYVLAAILDKRKRYIMVNLPPQVGKALALDTPIPTPNGWTTMGELRPGHDIYSHDGSLTKVYWVHDIYETETWRVTFSDGSSLECDGDHLWTLAGQRFANSWREHRGPNGWTDDWWSWRAPGKSDAGRRGGASSLPPTGRAAETVTTSEMAAHSVNREADGKERNNWRIPNGRIEGPDCDLPMDPYLLGYWLGDGTTGAPAFTCHVDDVGQLASRLVAAGVAHTVSQYSMPTVRTVRMTGMRPTMNGLGILGRKHIPVPYMRASWDQRAELLAGILDSDGYATGAGAEIGQQLGGLADQIAELVASLGGRCSLKLRAAVFRGEPTGKTVYRQTITTTFNPFRLGRKADAWAERAAVAKPMLRGQQMIVSAERTGETKQVRCITVDAPSQLYLAGRSMIPTHNSTFSGVFLPAWFLGMYPEKRVMFISYNDDYSVRYGRAVRTILDKFGMELFGTTVDRGANSASDWQMVDSFGGMLSTGIGGIITGLGAHLLVIDDIIKNIQEARSPTIKKMHVGWFDSTAATRLRRGGTMLITATRWAEDDLSGSLLERMKEPDYKGPKWEVLAFPALAEPAEDEEVEDEEAWRDALGRKMGESISPELFPVEDLEETKGGMDAFLWSCVYQQRPSSPTGGMFPKVMWKYWTEYPNIARRVRAWDLGTTEGAGDYTVGALWGLGNNGDLYLLARERGRWGTAEVERKVEACAKNDGYGTTIVIEQEKAGAGKAVVESYQRLLRGYSVKPGNEPGSKEQRATPYSIMQQAGRCHLPADAWWKDEWIKEHSGMMGDGRRGPHDDQVDCGAYAALELLGAGIADMWMPTQGSYPNLSQQADMATHLGPYDEGQDAGNEEEDTLGFLLRSRISDVLSGQMH